MNLIPWRNKQRELSGLQAPGTGLGMFRDEMDRLFDRFLHDPWGTNLLEDFSGRLGWGPRVDLAENDSVVTVKAELPGLTAQDVEIKVVGNTLTLRGEKKQEKEEKKQDYHYVERQYGVFHRTVQLPCAIDESKVDARYKDGILTITLPKHPESKARRITVQSG